MNIALYVGILFECVLIDGISSCLQFLCLGALWNAVRVRPKCSKLATGSPEIQRMALCSSAVAGRSRAVAASPARCSTFKARFIPLVLISSQFSNLFCSEIISCSGSCTELEHYRNIASRQMIERHHVVHRPFPGTATVNDIESPMIKQPPQHNECSSTEAAARSAMIALATEINTSHTLPYPVFLGGHRNFERTGCQTAISR